MPPNSSLILSISFKLHFSVLKYGLYNAINATYDGRHGMCSHQQFRKYIEEMVKFEKNELLELRKSNNNTKQKKVILSFKVFN